MFFLVLIPIACLQGVRARKTDPEQISGAQAVFDRGRPRRKQVHAWKGLQAQIAQAALAKGLEGGMKERRGQGAGSEGGSRKLFKKNRPLGLKKKVYMNSGRKVYINPFS